MTPLADLPRMWANEVPGTTSVNGSPRRKRGSRRTMPDQGRAERTPSDGHAPQPGPLYWNWRCLTCGGAVSDHLSLLRRFMSRVRRWRAKRHVGPEAST